MTILTIPQRFNGPAGSANGGYASGCLARAIDGPAEVTLRLPPPLGTPMRVMRHDDGMQLMADDALVAEASPTVVDVGPPLAVAPDDAARAAKDYTGFVRHAFPTCFVCGPERPDRDGLGIFCGPVSGTDVVAAVWTPDPEFASSDGTVAPPVVWAALDCPSFFGSNAPPGAVLGRIAVDVREPLLAGTPVVVIAWAGLSEGRKHESFSAILRSGEPSAVARSLWIAPRED